MGDGRGVTSTLAREPRITHFFFVFSYKTESHQTKRQTEYRRFRILLLSEWEFPTKSQRSVTEAFLDYRKRVVLREGTLVPSSRDLLQLLLGEGFNH